MQKLAETAVVIALTIDSNGNMESGLIHARKEKPHRKPIPIQFYDAMSGSNASVNDLSNAFCSCGISRRTNQDLQNRTTQIREYQENLWEKVANWRGSQPMERPIPFQNHHPSCSHRAPPAPAPKQTIKINVSTGSDGHINVHFSTPAMADFWTISGILPDSDDIQVHHHNPRGL